MRTSLFRTKKGFSISASHPSLTHEGCGRVEAMEFSFTEEQLLLQKTLRQYAKSELLPNYHRWDRGEKFPREKILEMGQLGLLGLRVPERYGGQDASFVTCGIASEEISRGDFNYGLFIQLSCIPAELFRAKASPEVQAGGVSAFLVPLDRPGITRTVYRSRGERLSARGSLFFDGARIPARFRLGEEREGFTGAMVSFDFNRAFIALSAVGAALQSLEETVEYTKTRQAFGRPLAKFEGVSFQVAEHLTLVEGARLIAFKCLWLKDQGLPHTKESAMSKWLGPKAAVEAIHACLILHGHYGYNQESPLEQRMRDVIGLEIGDGTPEIMKGIVAREVYGREFMSYR